MSAALDEDVKRVKALHQWLTSQEIPREEWTPLLMLSVAQDVWSCSNGKSTLRGQLLVSEMLVLWSSREILNA